MEFWADGRWHYLGACEPEPVPDRGWFTEPARRATLCNIPELSGITEAEVRDW
ncbi:MAG: hypothetical protein U5L72_11235 [Bacteroidales bacterium]|nr:hypothetical protein [Bacteroidales bacterium]